MQNMYPGKVNSPQTELASAIDDEQTTIPLLDASVLPDPPNLATIGTGENAETVLYEGIDGNDLIDVTRGFQGTAQSWSAGVKVARLFTAYDLEAVQQNILSHAARHATGGADPLTPEMIGAETPAGAQAKADQVKSYADANFVPKIVFLSSGADVNDVVTSGFYRLSSGHLSTPPGTDNGQLIVSRGGDTIFQFITGHSNNKFYMRQGRNLDTTPVWQPWRELITDMGGQTINGLLNIKNTLKVIGNATGDPNIAIVEFYDSNGTTRRGAVGDAASANDDIHVVADTGDVVVLAEGSQRLRIEGAGNVRPGPDNVQNLGTAQFRWKEVFAGAGTINTSDENEKEQITDLSEAERAVAAELKGLIKKFKFKDAVALKGSAARWHFGVIAQEVEAAFAAHGLDAHEYGLFCKDTWWEREEVRTPMIENPNFDPDQPEGEDNPRLIPGEPYTETVVYNEPVDGAVQRTRLGIRYDELLAFVIAAL